MRKGHMERDCLRSVSIALRVDLIYLIWEVYVHSADKKKKKEKSRMMSLKSGVRETEWFGETFSKMGLAPYPRWRSPR